MIHTNFHRLLKSWNLLAEKLCDIPPDLWCDSLEAARRCNVLQQCGIFRRAQRPIKITLLYEALCPYCQKLITNQIGQLYDEFRGQIELELVPWGNSRLVRGHRIICNHGQIECNANRFQSCVLDAVKVRYAIPFIVCFERSLTASNFESALQHCSGFIRNHYRKIRNCYDTDRGYQLQLQAAHRTMSVRPNPIAEVPYLLINDYSPNIDTNNLNIRALKHLLKKWLSKKRFF